MASRRRASPTARRRRSRSPDSSTRSTSPSWTSGFPSSRGRQRARSVRSRAGAPRAVVCDTVGVMTPPGIRWFFGRLKERLIPTQLSFHGHNDFGLAVANSLAAVEEGVEVPHTCVNGLGERSGNASFEEFVLALESLYGFDTGIDVSRLYELSQLVERLSGIPVAVGKPLVGHNAFAHESGIHAHGVIKHTATY